MRLASGGDSVVTERISGPGLVGDYARPRGRGPWPALILLHGSEGGDLLGEERAQRFAAQGFASLSLTYFADSPVAGTSVPTSLKNIPLERVDDAFRWLAGRPEVRPEAVGVVGMSRGAELALLVASHSSWARAVVACVPSDVVWPGWSNNAPVTTDFAAWTFRGSPLAYMPLDHGADHAAWPAPFKSAAEGFQTSRIEYANRLPEVRIPVERIKAPLLLLGSGQDTTWPSAIMAETIYQERASLAGHLMTKLKTYPQAGHEICTSPNWPLRLYEKDGENGSSLSTEAEGEATVDAWRTTLAFLKRNLR